MTFFKSLPKANARIEELTGDVERLTNRLIDVEKGRDEQKALRDGAEKRFLAQTQELIEARKQIDRLHDARLEAQLGFARAIGYIAALKGDPFPEHVDSNIVWRG